MNLDKFRGENKLNIGISIEDCKSKIRLIFEENVKIEEELKNFEKDYMEEIKNEAKNFLTEDLSFIENYEKNRLLYLYKDNKDEIYKIIFDLKNNDIKFISFYFPNNMIEFRMSIDYKDVQFNKLSWSKKENEWWDESNEYELVRSDHTIIQENKEYWNRELNAAIEIEKDNKESYERIKNKTNKERFEIILLDQNTSSNIKVSDIVEWLKDILEKNN